jgi:hypothetical protein
MKFEIKSWFSGSVIFEGEFGSMKLCVEAAISQKKSLSDADLSGADLRNAVLRNADLSGADLRNAVLRNADLSDAVLRNADLSGADLRNAVLRNAFLSDAVLRNADLSGADLSGADLRNAFLSDAVLRNADLSVFKHDIWAVLSASPREAEKLLASIKEGRIEGSCYEGECACLVGTIANIAGKHHRELPVLKPDAGRPAETFFLNIHKGDKPSNNQFSKLAAEWVEQWITLQKEAFATSTK